MRERQLPDCEKARIEDAKLYKYLLNTEHPEGKSKARFYKLVGYTIDKGEQLRVDLLTLACSGSVTNELPNRVGRKYVVVGTVNAPNGKSYKILSVWAAESQRGTAPDDEPHRRPGKTNNCVPKRQITMIQELDLVALLPDRPALGLSRGDVGTVVHIYGSGDLYEVEFTNAKGDTVAVETLNADEIRPVDLNRVRLHYNDLERVA